MKKIFISIMAALLIIVSCLSVFAVSFDDIADNAYYKGAAERMAARGILSGYGDGMYYGGEPVTRAQIAALVCKMLDKTAEAASLAGKTVFSDVLEDAWYTGYINYAVANDIIVGDGDDRFRPDDNVKYEEVVKVVVCVLGLDKGIKINSSDWSKEYIQAAEKAGLLKKLIGKKGTPMLRSDIAVICDAAMTVLDKQADVTTTTKRSVMGPSSSKPSTTEATDTSSKPASTTTRENALPGMDF